MLKSCSPNWRHGRDVVSNVLCGSVRNMKETCMREYLKNVGVPKIIVQFSYP